MLEQINGGRTEEDKYNIEKEGVIYLIFLPITAILLGIYLLVSGIRSTLKDTKNINGKFSRSLVTLLEIAWDLISEEGQRIFFGVVFIVLGILVFLVV
ncbi:hypothetical protein ACR0S4_28600 [Priestia megaterium]|uniref:hypothetical protein n=1 Tax=Priestia megaterium TaxID=1404 RepID=UPI003D9748DE